MLPLIAIGGAISAVATVIKGASWVADKLGSSKVANVVMLGALLEETECMSPETAMLVIESEVKKPHLLEVNRQALEAGRKFVEKAAHAGPISQPDGFAY